MPVYLVIESSQKKAPLKFQAPENWSMNETEITVNLAPRQLKTV
jgi:hypothetical protein